MRGSSSIRSRRRPLAPNSHAFSVGSALGTTTISTIVGWPAGTDDASGIRNYTLEQQVNARRLDDRGLGHDRRGPRRGR